VGYDSLVDISGFYLVRVKVRVTINAKYVTAYVMINRTNLALANAM